MKLLKELDNGNKSIYFISFYTDKKFESKFNKICLSILIVSFMGIGCGILTFPIQEKINSNKAEKFVAEIEKLLGNNDLAKVEELPISAKRLSKNGKS